MISTVPAVPLRALQTEIYLFGINDCRLSDADGEFIRAATQKGRKFAYLIIRADYLDPSYLDDFVHLRLNSLEQDSRESGREGTRGRRSRKAREKWPRGKRFEYSVKTDLSRHGNNYLLRTEDTFEVIVTEATEFR